MGYTTSYELEWKAITWQPVPLCPHKPPPEAKFCATCGKPNQNRQLDDVVGSYIEEHEEMRYALAADGSTNESCKWYDHLEDLEQMSKAIPGVLFHLSGEGESAADIWDAFALNGETQKHEAEIIRVTEPKPWASPTGGEGR